MTISPLPPNKRSTIWIMWPYNCVIHLHRLYAIRRVQISQIYVSFFERGENICHTVKYPGWWNIKEKIFKKFSYLGAVQPTSNCACNAPLKLWLFLFSPEKKKDFLSDSVNNSYKTIKPNCTSFGSNMWAIFGRLLKYIMQFLFALIRSQ